jgi:uncharacterized protein (DUF885 family)
MLVRRLNSIITLVIAILTLAGCGLFLSEPSPTVSPTAVPEASIQPEIEVDSRSQVLETATEEATPSPGAISSSEGFSLHEFFETSFRDLTLRSPETVLTYGLTNIYGVTEVSLNDISDTYQRETYSLMADILETLESYDRAALTPEDQISYDIYHWYLQDQLTGQAFMYHDYPATFFPPTAVHEDLILFFTDLHPVTCLEDAQDYVTRLKQVGTKIDQLIAGMEIRKEAGIEPPEFAIQWATYGSLGEFVRTSARSNILYTSFEEKVTPMSSGTPEENQAVLDEAEQAIETVVLPAYRKLHRYLLSLPTYTQQDSGVWRLPQGDAYYAYLLRHYTTTELSAEEIHQLGLDELARIHTEMAVLFEQLGYPKNETLGQSFDRVARDGGHVSGNEVLTTYEELISTADRNLEAAFDIRPQADVVVIPDQYGGFYVAGSIDGLRPGAFYAGVGGSGEDYYAMPTLAYHEAIPGHHFQIALAQEMRDLPSFRQGLQFTAYTEGWALYTEQLAAELGWYADDPYGMLGMLQAQAFRAARLVVDTGLHAKRWTFEHAQAFFTENTGFEMGDSVNPEQQIARYVVWPGQATSYYVGYLQYMDLRQRAMDQLGDKFDLIEFHRVILSNGSMPLGILESLVNRYIADKAGS